MSSNKMVKASAEPSPPDANSSTKTESISSPSNSPLKGERGHSSSSSKKCVYEKLFEKELTPSDVGKLNRLVIPKMYAVKFTPVLLEIAGDGDGDGTGGVQESTELVFYDDQSMKKTWKFRYCCVKGSKSYMFTGSGWASFVKEKGLKAKDTLNFYKAAEMGRNFCMIEVVKNTSGGGETSTSTSGVDQSGGALLTENESGIRDVDSSIGGGEQVAQQVKGFRLFGVQIN